VRLKESTIRHLIPAPFLKGVAVLLFLLCGTNLFAGDSLAVTRNVKGPDYYLDDEQSRIDWLDGTLDKKLDVGDADESLAATAVFFPLIDSVQRLITTATFDNGRKKIYREHVYYQLKRVNDYNYHNVKRFEGVFKFILSELNAIKQNRLLPLLTSNISYSFHTLGLVKNEACADSFLIFAARYKPEMVFKNYDAFYTKDYTLHVLEEAAKIAPVTLKRYFNKGNGIFETLKQSNDTVIKTLLKIRELHTTKSNAFTLIDDIAKGKITIDEANSIGNQPQKYLMAMLRIRASRNPMAVYSLDQELEIYSLKFVRVLNDLHNEKDEVRFASIENFSPEEIYTLLVYSEEEIFTSTFNGLFNRLMIKMGPVSGLEFLESLGNNRFRTFIKMSAGFGKLRSYMQTMTPTHQQMLMINFASGLEKYNDLSQAVEVADAFGSISDTLVLKILRGVIRLEYFKMKKADNAKGAAIYGLLSNLFVEKNVKSEDWFTAVARQYKLPSFDKIEKHKLFAFDSINRWLIYFYDDEDGDASFTSFIKSFTDPVWNIIDSGSYVIIRSKAGRPVHIYANKPKHEYDGQELLEKIFDDNNYEPNVMVHRGHSYYAYKTIDKIRDNTKVFVLGSCGGYHSISGIIERSPEISIISSKQIGTMFVNNPMLKLMADNIRNDNDIQWQALWADLDKEVKLKAQKENAKAYERFLDYIPPHKNLGAIFIKTYNSIMEAAQ
jgi:hypothetical protein